MVTEMKGLRLEISMERMDSFDGMEDTYRREGLTVGSDYMRIHGVDFNVRSDNYAMRHLQKPNGFTITSYEITMTFFNTHSIWLTADRWR